MLNVYDNKSNSHLLFDYLANNRSKNQNMFLDGYLNHLIRTIIVKLILSEMYENIILDFHDIRTR